MQLEGHSLFLAVDYGDCLEDETFSAFPDILRLSVD